MRLFLCLCPEASLPWAVLRKEGTALMGRAFSFPCCEDSHRGGLQALSRRSLDTEWRGGDHQPALVRGGCRQPLPSITLIRLGCCVAGGGVGIYTPRQSTGFLMSSLG